jgi:phosphatidylserine/phosphatidylglycerophosphate/cardiolipin synthase-like enzyme
MEVDNEQMMKKWWAEGDIAVYTNSRAALLFPCSSHQIGTSPHSWHDAHALIEGPAAGDVEHNFRQRWNSVVERHARKDLLLH